MVTSFLDLFVCTTVFACTGLCGVFFLAVLDLAVGSHSRKRVGSVGIGGQLICILKMFFLPANLVGSLKAQSCYMVHSGKNFFSPKQNNQMRYDAAPFGAETLVALVSR